MSTCYLLRLYCSYLSVGETLLVHSYSYRSQRSHTRTLFTFVSSSNDNIGITKMVKPFNKSFPSSALPTPGRRRSLRAFFPSLLRHGSQRLMLPLHSALLALVPHLFYLADREDATVLDAHYVSANGKEIQKKWLDSLRGMCRRFG